MNNERKNAAVAAERTRTRTRTAANTQRTTQPRTQTDRRGSAASASASASASPPQRQPQPQRKRQLSAKPKPKQDAKKSNNTLSRAATRSPSPRKNPPPANRKKTARKGNVNVVTTPADVRALDDVRRFDSSKPYVVLVHATWCSHCRNLRPHWERAAHEMQDAGLQVVDMEMSALPEARRHASPVATELERNGEIAGVPHIAYVSPGVRAVDYDSSYSPEEAMAAAFRRANGPRTAPHILKFVKDQQQRDARLARQASS